MIDIDAEGLPPKYDAAADFGRQCDRMLMPAYECEVKFAKDIGRFWKFDYAWRKYMIAVEIEGLIVFRGASGNMQVGGGHGTVQGIKRDMIKANTAQLLGWQLYRFDQSMVKSRHAAQFIYRALCRRGWKPKS
jgi:hypothetical protein